MEKLRVVWICDIANQEIRNHLDLLNPNLYWKCIIKKILGYKSRFNYTDYPTWNTLAVKEFENFEDIELHIVSLQIGMKKKRQDFQLNGVFYHCISPSADTFLEKKIGCIRPIFKSFGKNRKQINQILDNISPDVINLIGAENPSYSIAGLDIDINKIPFLVSLQTLMSDPCFLDNYPIDLDSYYNRSAIERELLRRTKYIASSVSWYRQLACFWNSSAQMVKFHFCNEMKFQALNAAGLKKYDFVYYSLNIEKAGEDAIMAFFEAYKLNPILTLDIIGGANASFYTYLKSKINELGIQNNIHFSGLQNTHEDVLKQVIKSKYALLPIKIDIVSTTVREAIMLGLPIVTTITKGTPALNRDKECVLLSEISNYSAMGKNMLRLIEEPNLGEQLVKNAKEFAAKIWDNKKEMRDLADIYHAIFENFHNSTPIPPQLTFAAF